MNTISGKCNKCANTELKQELPEIYQHNLPDLGPLTETITRFVCTNCNREARSQINVHRPATKEVIKGPIEKTETQESGLVKEKYASLLQNSSDRKLRSIVQYPAIYRETENKLVPTGEGKIEDGTIIDQYGDPDLMVEFSIQYYKHYKAVRPRGRFPNSVSEIMPMLHLLVTATELSIKAFLIRSNQRPDLSHKLSELYEKLDNEHKLAIEKVFSMCDRKADLKRLGKEGPTVSGVLKVYDDIYGDRSSVYKETRYYAEPTTVTFNPNSNLHGSNLVKGNTPYPIFLPNVVEAIIDRFRYFSGSERLLRIGADILQNGYAAGTDNHGDWSIVPCSLGLVVLSVSQEKGISATGDNKEIFNSFKKNNPAVFSTDWMYGGKTLLFYTEDGRTFQDGLTVIYGLECKIWYKERLGLHTRDLYILADALDKR